jgi:hypothetical protein
MRLYMFVARRHFEAGSLRLPTIYSFRDTVEIGKGRVDDEGQHSL